MQREESLATKITDHSNVDKPITPSSVESFANSIYQALRQEGCEQKDIIGVSSQLLGLVTSALGNPEENDQNEK